MAEDRRGDVADVVDCGENAAFRKGAGRSGEDERLAGAGACAS